jgi:hypothetical protein
MLNSRHFMDNFAATMRNGQGDRTRTASVETCIANAVCEGWPTLGGTRIIHEPTVAKLHHRRD